ncbi:MAG: M48 family metallopeptidase [Opitutaceae bacterium]|nr:M48 family metallopeptidase [Cytophagales bacterium]
MSEPNIYDGRLFDGKSSSSIHVSVILYSDRLVIHPKSDDVITGTQTWKTSLIKDYRNSTNEVIQVSYGEYPSQVLEIVSADFAIKFKPPVSGFDKFSHSIVHSGVGIIAFISAAVIGLLLLLYFFALPFLAEQSVNLIPKEYEIKMGASLYENMIKTEKVDIERSKFANQFLKQINFETDYPLQVTVVNSEIKNAFALPGGHIVVYTALLNDMKQYEELVALLGHEAGHVTERHTTKHIFRSMSGYLLVSILFGDLSGITALVIDNANQIHQLSYSRSLETQADNVGYKTMVKNAINPKGIISLFENLQKGNEAGNQIPEFLSTHPVTENRMKNISDKIKKEKPVYVDHAFLEGIFKQVIRNK